MELHARGGAARACRATRCATAWSAWDSRPTARPRGAGAAARRRGRPAPPTDDVTPSPECAAETRRRVTLLQVRLVPAPADAWETSRGPSRRPPPRCGASAGQIEERAPARCSPPSASSPTRMRRAARPTPRSPCGRSPSGRAATPPTSRRRQVALHTGAVGDPDGRPRRRAIARAPRAQRRSPRSSREPPPGTVVGQRRRRPLPRPPLRSGSARADGARRRVPRSSATRRPARPASSAASASCASCGECFERVAGRPGPGRADRRRARHRKVTAAARAAPAARPGATWVRGPGAVVRALDAVPSGHRHAAARVPRSTTPIPEAVVVEKLERAVRQRVGRRPRDTLPFLRYLLSVDPGDPAVLAMDPGGATRRSSGLPRSPARAGRRSCARTWSSSRTCTGAIRPPRTGSSPGRDRIAAKRVLVLLTYRPGYRPAFGEPAAFTPRWRCPRCPARTA